MVAATNTSPAEETRPSPPPPGRRWRRVEDGILPPYPGFMKTTSPPPSSRPSRCRHEQPPPYDYSAGYLGVMGCECSGITPPFIKEFIYAMPRNCTGGNTGVCVNGGELHQKDFDLLVRRGLPRISGKSYSVEISGNVTDETSSKKLHNLGKLAPTIEKNFGMHVPEEIS